MPRTNTRILAALTAAALAATVTSPLGAQDRHGGKNAAPAQLSNQKQADEGPDPVIAVPDTDAAMAAARAEAQATLPQWLELYAAQPDGYYNFVIKFPLEGVEHIWVTVSEVKGDVLIGTLDNAPHADGWSYGDRVEVPMALVSDWAYFDDQDVAHGYRTTRAMFKYMDPSEVAAVKSQLGWE